MVSLHILMARSAPVAVVMRLGPGRRVQLVHWDTSRDHFAEGQTLRGNLHPGLSGLSPDGSKLVYFARGLRPSAVAGVPLAGRLPYAFTAISRPPYFAPLALWAADALGHGGGHFTDGRTLWLNHRADDVVPIQTARPPASLRTKAIRVSEEYDPLRTVRLEAAGWSPRWTGRSRNGDSEVWERSQPGGHAVLIRRVLPLRFNAAGGPYVETFAVRNPAGAELQLKATWADWDPAGRLVLVRGARLYEGAVLASEGDRLLADFSRTPRRPLEVPAWALGWESEPALPPLTLDHSVAAG